MTGDKPAGYKFYRRKRYILQGGLTRQKDQEWGGGRANCSSDKENYLPDHYSNISEQKSKQTNNCSVSIMVVNKYFKVQPMYRKDVQTLL